MATKKSYEHAILILADTPKAIEDQLNILSKDGWDTSGLTISVTLGKDLTVSGIIRREIK